MSTIYHQDPHFTLRLLNKFGFDTMIVQSQNLLLQEKNRRSLDAIRIHLFCLFDAFFYKSVHVCNSKPWIKNTTPWVINAVRVPLLSLDERLKRYKLFLHEQSGGGLEIPSKRDIESLQDAILGLEDRSSVFSLVPEEPPHRVRHEDEYKYIFYTTEHAPSRVGTIIVRVWYVQVLNDKSRNILISQSHDGSQGSPCLGSFEVNSSADIMSVVLVAGFGNLGRMRIDLLKQLGVTDFCGWMTREEQAKDPALSRVEPDGQENDPPEELEQESCSEESEC